MPAGHTKTRGAALAEFALVVPLLLALVFGIIHFGIALNRLQALHAAAREGARTASLPSNNVADIEDAVAGALDGLSIVYTVTAAQTCQGRRGQTVAVEVSSSYTISIPLLPSKDVDLTGRGVFRCE